MFGNFIKNIFGSSNDRVIRRMRAVVEKVNSLEEKMSSLQDHKFPMKTAALRERIEQGEKPDDLLPEAFALVREAGKRKLEMRHFDVQLIGGMVLNDGMIAEMKTGEGKTLVATLASYINALSNRGVHIVTVNDYLAKRDAEWMSEIYQFLGMQTGVLVSGISPQQRRDAYAADITYGTNNEFGFDYLRDNLVTGKYDCVQRNLHYAIVDEVDCILIDEARTPLIISGPVDEQPELYLHADAIVPSLKLQNEENSAGDYTIDEKTKQAYLSEEGNERIESLLRSKGIIGLRQNLYDPSSINVLHHLNIAIRAHALFHKDVDYIVKDNEVVIVDEFTGRTMVGRRWSDGLHQAIEAKEGVPIQNENQTLATITYQNYFRLYKKLSGMTGTADTEAFEFQHIYDLEVVVVPTNQAMIRADASDTIFLRANKKFMAILDDIRSCQKRQQPVLVGTTSIEVSEYLSAFLKKANIKHQVLNAKFHQKEAEIIACAGEPSAVTIATNMAGRGTDIVLGGNLDAELSAIKSEDVAVVKTIKERWQKNHQTVIASGGLHIIGTERHESRRIDNQLRGRAGRQGDPGSSRFYLSLEDNLMRIFASDKVSALMQKLGVDDDEAIESILVSRAIENAQRKVEGHNFDIRKHLLEFDNVVNDQRKVIYQQRYDLLHLDDISELIQGIQEDVINDTIKIYIPPGSVSELWDIPGLEKAIDHKFNLKMNVADWLEEDNSLHEENLCQKIIDNVKQFFLEKEEVVGPQIMRNIEKQMMLNILDRNWKDHLISMDHLRQGINLRGYAAKDPKQEYKREAFAMFVQVLESIKHDIIYFLSMMQISTEPDAEVDRQRHHRSTDMRYQHAPADSLLSPKNNSVTDKNSPFVRDQKKLGRNEPCYCGSGKKYKQCHGLLKS